MQRNLSSKQAQARCNNPYLSHTLVMSYSRHVIISLCIFSYSCVSSVVRSWTNPKKSSLCTNALRVRTLCALIFFFSDHNSHAYSFFLVVVDWNSSHSSCILGCNFHSENLVGILGSGSYNSDHSHAKISLPSRVLVLWSAWRATYWTNWDE